MQLTGITKFARIVSFLFDGSVLALPIFVAVCFYDPAGSIQAQILPAFFVSYFFIAAIPYSFILLLYKTGRISDLQIPKRKERLLPLLIINICVISGFLVLLFLKSSALLKTVYLIYLLGLPVISIITVFYKISFHSSYITMFSLIYLMVFGKWAIATLLLIPLVSWSRVKLRRHTTGQVLLGIAVISAVSLTIFTINGFLWTGYWAVREVKEFFSNTSFYLRPSLPFYGSGNPLIVIMIITLFFSLFYRKQNLFSENLAWLDIEINNNLEEQAV
ncbi:MAG: hypothetical protein FJW68_00410 [Actinobacteria bacterium]|nr:hypothetical protein [Actinomycetota bacterium]